MDDDKIEIFMGKIDERTVNIQRDVIEIKDNLKLQNSRIGKLEQAKAKLIGVAIGISTIVSIGIQFAKKFIINGK